MRRQILAAGMAALVIAAASAGYIVGRVQSHPAVTAVRATVADAESCLIAAVNADRVSATVATLPVDPALSSYARSHSEAMAASGTIYHTGASASSPIPTDMAFRAGLPQPWRTATKDGENVGEDPNGCTDMEQAFMNSPPHRANILDASWTEMGIGVAFDASGEMYVTQDFSELHASAPPTHAASTTPAPIVVPAVTPRAPSPSPSPNCRAS